MIICHIITAFGFGGAEKLLVDLANVQAEKHEVHIVYLKGQPHLKKLLRDGISVHNVPMQLNIPNKLRSFIKNLAPDVVHTHVGHADFLGLWASRGLAVKRITTMHNIRYKWNALDHLIFRIYRILFRTVAKDAKIVAISQAVSHHVENVLKVKSSNIRLIYNAIPAVILSKDKMELRSELNIPKTSFSILFLGRLELAKSVETLILAANEIKERIPELLIVIVGAGSLKEQLEHLVLNLKISHLVCFTGPTTEAQKYFSACDLFVLPSIFEGFGIVIIEAFRASLPVIATATDGPKELISHEANGLLFEPLNYRELAAHIYRLYSSEKLRLYLGRNGYQTYAGKYEISTYAEKIENLYQE